MSHRNVPESKQSDLFSSEHFPVAGNCDCAPVDLAPITDADAPPAPAAPESCSSNGSNRPIKSVKLPGEKRNTRNSTANSVFGPFLNARQVAARYSVSVATIWRWTKQRADFPQAKKLGSGSTRWMLDELLEFEAGLSKDK